MASIRKTFGGAIGQAVRRVQQTFSQPSRPAPAPRLVPQSSQTNPYAANYRGATIPQSSQVNPYAANYQSRQTINFSPQPQGQILGVQSRPSGGGGGGQPQGGGGQSFGGEQPSGGMNQDYFNQGQQGYPSSPQIDFDALIAPALQALDQYIPTLESNYQGTVESVGANKKLQQEKQQQYYGGLQKDTEANRGVYTNQAENAADEARRQYAEIQQGIQSRYGGTTGTGAFATELAGRQALQNIGRTRQGLSEALQGIDNKVFQIREVAKIAQNDIETQSNEQVRQAKQNLDNQLADIRRQKGDIQVRKAELAANAIQVYQQTVNQVAAQNATFKQNLILSQVNAENTLALYRQRAQDTMKQGVTPTFSAGSNNLNIRGGLNTQTQPTMGAGRSIGNFSQGQSQTSDLERQLRQQYGLY